MTNPYFDPSSNYRGTAPSTPRTPLKAYNQILGSLEQGHTAISEPCSPNKPISYDHRWTFYISATGTLVSTITCVACIALKAFAPVALAALLIAVPCAVATYCTNIHIKKSHSRLNTEPLTPGVGGSFTHISPSVLNRKSSLTGQVGIVAELANSLQKQKAAPRMGHRRTPASIHLPYGASLPLSVHGSPSPLNSPLPGSPSPLNSPLESLNEDSPLSASSQTPSPSTLIRVTPSSAIMQPVPSPRLRAAPNDQLQVPQSLPDTRTKTVRALSVDTARARRDRPLTDMASPAPFFNFVPPRSPKTSSPGDVLEHNETDVPALTSYPFSPRNHSPTRPLTVSSSEGLQIANGEATRKHHRRQNTWTKMTDALASNPIKNANGLFKEDIRKNQQAVRIDTSLHLGTDGFKFAIQEKASLRHIAADIFYSFGEYSKSIEGLYKELKKDSRFTAHAAHLRNDIELTVLGLSFMSETQSEKLNPEMLLIKVSQILAFEKGVEGTPKPRDYDAYSVGQTLAKLVIRHLSTNYEELEEIEIENLVHEVLRRQNLLQLDHYRHLYEIFLEHSDPIAALKELHFGFCKILHTDPSSSQSQPEAWKKLDINDVRRELTQLLITALHDEKPEVFIKALSIDPFSIANNSKDNPHPVDRLVFINTLYKLQESVWRLLGCDQPSLAACMEATDMVTVEVGAN